MNKSVDDKFTQYPAHVQKKMHDLRTLILETAAENAAIGELEETLKWGEPSYLSRIGSTVRIDWKEKAPHKYAIYFNCNTILVETFRELYGDSLSFEGNRAISLNLDVDPPRDILKHCISLALTYHKVKHLPLLGA